MASNVTGGWVVKGAGKTVAQFAGKVDDVASLVAKQLKRLSPGEINKLKQAGFDPHDLKPNSKFDLFKDEKGNIFVKPKDGSGPGDPTGININNP